MTDINHIEMAVIGDEDLVNGLRLGGVRRYRTIENSDREEIRKALTEFMNEPDIGIVVILEDYAEQVEDIIAKAAEKKTSSTVVVEVPSKYGTRYKDITEYYRSYIKKFIGFDIEI